MSFATELAALTPRIWWRLGDAGPTANDSGSDNNDGTATGTPAPTFGTTGLITSDTDDAVLFANDDTSKARILSGALADETLTEWTLGAIVTFDDLRASYGYQFIWGIYNPTVNPDTQIELSLNLDVADMYLLVGGGDEGDHATAWDPTPAVVDTRYFVVGTYDGTDLELYVNGALVATTNNPGVVDTVQDSPLFGAGNHGDGSFDASGDGVAGTVDEVFFCDYAVTLADVETLYAEIIATVSQDVEVPFLDLSPTIYAPTLAREGEITVPFLDLAPTIFAPALGKHAAPGDDDPLSIRVVSMQGVPHTASGLTGGRLELAHVESIKRNLNEPDECVIVFPKHAYDRADVHIFADDSGSGDAHEIQVIRNGKVRFWGPAVMADTNSDDGTVTMHCRSVDWYLSRRFIDGQRDNLMVNPSFETGTFFGWAAQGALTRTIVTSDVLRGDYAARLVSATDLGDIFQTQSVVVTGNGVGTLITVVSYFKLESISGHALDRRGLYVEGVQNGVVKANDFYPIDEATPVGEWTRAKCRIQVPANTTWTLRIRQYSPPGSILWDDGQAVAMQSVSTAGLTGSVTEPVDISRIVKQIMQHVQSPAVGKSRLYIGTDVETVGETQVKHIQWADHISWPDQMAEWLERDDCFDYGMRYTTTTRTLEMHVPTRGVDRTNTVELVYGPGGNVAGYTFEEDGGGTITDATILADDTGTGADREEGHANDTDQLGGITLQSVEAAPQRTEVNSLDPIAREKLNNAKRPAQLLTLEVVNRGSVEYDELLGVGDTVSYEVPDGWVTVAGEGRIVSIEEFPRTRRCKVTLNKVA